MDTIKYDASVIEEFAARLYTRAKTMVLLYGLLGFFVGFLGGAGALVAARHETGFAWVAAFVCMLVGAAIGREKGFTLRLQAQQALCQTKIEQNTRGAARIAA